MTAAGRTAIGEIPWREQVCGGNYRHAHGAVFVGTLRPSHVFVNPDSEAHYHQTLTFLGYRIRLGLLKSLCLLPYMQEVDAHGS